MKNSHIAIFASGNGSNADRIIQYFEGNEHINVAAIFTNKKEAGVVELAEKKGIPVHIFTREDFYESRSVIESLKKLEVTHIVLAGFLWLIPANFIKAYEAKIINIHPALLPKFGGKGMYGIHVHKAVKLANEKETGITIHLVNENYDEGKYLEQRRVELNGTESAEEIAKKVQGLEHRYFPESIEKWINGAY